MKKYFGYYILSLFFALNIYSCAQTEANDISVDDLKSSMKNDSSLVILDVRTPAELEGPLGKIEGVINIPVQELGQRFVELEKYKESNIAVICRTGRRSAFATSLLVDKGFKAKNVLGGMVEFREFENAETEVQ